MEQTDRVKARKDALADLGLDPNAAPDDIRDAWRRIAFHAHPDHTGGDSANFARAKAAYDYLRKEGLTVKGANNGPSQPRRPRLRRRIIELEPEAIANCVAMLDPGRALPSAESHSAADPDAATLAESDHVPDAVGCYGRNLTYFVPTPVCEGANRIALPTSVLSSSRNSETEVLSFQSNDQGAGEVVIPDTICESKFPGAKSVRIRFEADQAIRNEYWLAS